jgi:hypothetical protein
LGDGLIGAEVADCPAVALVGSSELLMMVIRGSQVPVNAETSGVDNSDPLRETTAEVFKEQLAADRVPSIRAELHVGQLRAQRPRDYLATGAARRVEAAAV